MLYRIVLFTINVFFPPLSVLLVTGPYTDTLINCVLFLCGVIPSHIHAFYVNCTYFHRRKKVRKGRWPGGPKSLIFDRRVWYGGVSKAEAEEIRREESAKNRAKETGKKRRSRDKSQRGSSVIERQGYDGTAIPAHRSSEDNRSYKLGSTRQGHHGGRDDTTNARIDQNLHRLSHMSATSTGTPGPDRFGVSAGFPASGAVPPTQIPVSAQYARHSAVSQQPDRRTIVGEVFHRD